VTSSGKGSTQTERESYLNEANEASCDSTVCKVEYERENIDEEKEIIS